MPAVGRNEPCPCGSGKKYKKCCLRKDEAQAALRPAPAFEKRAPPPPPRSAAQAGGHGFAPYTVGRIFEQSDAFAKMKRDEPRRAALFWTAERIAALDTSAILARLEKLGVAARPEDFLPLATRTTSAWEISEVWRERLGGDIERHDDDFLGYAACELWKRYSPDRPSQEMLDDWMQEGYRLSQHLELARACDLWQKVWDVIRARLTPDMRTCDDAGAVFNGTQSITNWVDDFVLELRNAAIKEPLYAARGVTLCEQVLGQFLDEDDAFRRSFRAAMGELLFMAGRPGDGERVLQGLIEEFPDLAIGYAYLADALAGSERRPGTAEGRERAIALLEAALARPVRDAEDFSLRERLRDLRSR
jgi:hypothetical protein